MTYNVGWFSTGRDEAARNLLTAVYDRRGDLGVEIPFVFSNWTPGEQGKNFDDREEFFRLVKRYGIDLVPLSWRTFESELRRSDKEAWRLAYGEAMRNMLSGHDFDLGVLAGYMLVVDTKTCESYDLVNLHPALPNGPIGTWQEVIWELISKKAQTQGAMMHLVTEEMDRGHPVSYCAFPITGECYDELWTGIGDRSVADIITTEGEESELFRRIRHDGEVREIPLIANTIGAFSHGDVSVDSSDPENKIIVARNGDSLNGGYDITQLVDAEMGAVV